MSKFCIGSGNQSIVRWLKENKWPCRISDGKKMSKWKDAIDELDKKRDHHICPYTIGGKS